MEIIPILMSEMEQEANTTRKMLSRVPDDKFDWKPHPKSMSLKQLSTHIAELPAWVSMALTTEGINFATMDYKPTPVNCTNDLIDLFEKSYTIGKTNLKNAKEEDLLPKWVLRTGDKIHQTYSNKVEVIRMSFCQIVHHRAQLGVYLRLLDIPIPGSYGPSADEPNNIE